MAAPVVEEGAKQVQKVVEPALKAIEPSVKVRTASRSTIAQPSRRILASRQQTPSSPPVSTPPWSTAPRNP